MTTLPSEVKAELRRVLLKRKPHETTFTRMNGGIVDWSMTLTKTGLNSLVDELAAALQPEIERLLVAERDKVRDEITRLNWTRILDEAVKSRPTSWKPEPIWEYRNASDEVHWAMKRAAFAAGIFADPWKQAADVVKARLTHPKQQEEKQ